MCLVIRKPPLIRFSPFSSQSSWNDHHWDTIGPADLVMYGTWAVANKARWSGTHPGCVSPCLLQCCLGTCGATKHCGRELPKLQLIVIAMPLYGFIWGMAVIAVRCLSFLISASISTDPSLSATWKKTSNKLRVEWLPPSCPKPLFWFLVLTICECQRGQSQVLHYISNIGAGTL